MAKVLLTGGAGFIGSHTLVELLDRGYEVAVVDNLCNSCEEALRRVKKITGKNFKFYNADIRDRAAMEEIFAEDPLGPDPFTVIQSMLNRENFSRWLFQTALKINNALSRERDYAARQVIEKAKQYIMDNYQDPGLSVEQICRYLHMSPAYFSTMFKKATGQTYIAYLTEVRLNKAVELLNMTDEKTYVIASQVGYQEQNYFSYVFKKRFGVSPTKFRGSR